MKLVKATSESARRRLRVKELGRVAVEGETFEVTDERFKVLAGDNKFHAQFVIPADEKVKEPETVKVPEPVVEETPEIFMIEPGKEPVKVDENLQPVKEEEVIQTEKKKRSRKKKAATVEE